MAKEKVSQQNKEKVKTIVINQGSINLIFTCTDFCGRKMVLTFA